MSKNERNRVIAEMYKSGLTLQECGNAYGITRERVRAILERQGVQRRKDLGKPYVNKTFEEKLSNRIALFWKYVRRIEQSDQCWEWTGVLTGAGYPRLSWQGKVQYAHRIAFYLTHKRFPADSIIRTCRNRICCNPTHLKEVPPVEAAKHRDETRRQMAA